MYMALLRSGFYLQVARTIIFLVGQPHVWATFVLRVGLSEIMVPKNCVWRSYKCALLINRNVIEINVNCGSWNAYCSISKVSLAFKQLIVFQIDHKNHMFMHLAWRMSWHVILLLWDIIYCFCHSKIKSICPFIPPCHHVFISTEYPLTTHIKALLSWRRST